MDFTLPGYNYLGPGNPLDKGEPTNESDRVAYLHDIEYQKYLDNGLNPYINFNDADEQAIRGFKDDIGGMIGKYVFTAKKVLRDAGLIGHISLPKRIGQMDPNELPPPKRQRTDADPITIVTVPRGAVNRPIVQGGAIRRNGRRSRTYRRRSFRSYGRRRYGGYRRRSYRRRY